MSSRLDPGAGQPLAVALVARCVLAMCSAPGRGIKPPRFGEPLPAPPGVSSLPTPSKRGRRVGYLVEAPGVEPASDHDGDSGAVVWELVKQGYRVSMLPESICEPKPGIEQVLPSYPRWSSGLARDAPRASSQPEEKTAHERGRLRVAADSSAGGPLPADCDTAGGPGVAERMKRGLPNR